MKVRWQDEPIESTFVAWLRGRLRRRIAAYVRDGKPFKIGITNDPKRRANQYGNEYDEMIVLYPTGYSEFVRDLEHILIEDFWEYCDNEVGGGGGPVAEPPYYLYIVVSDAPATIPVLWKDEAIRGRLEAKVSRLRRRISQFAANSNTFEIGMTSAPNRRAVDCDEYDEMVVLYRTSDENTIRTIETDLITSFRNHRRNRNYESGGDGPLARPPYYLYIVRDRR